MRFVGITMIAIINGKNLNEFIKKKQSAYLHTMYGNFSALKLGDCLTEMQAMQ